MPESLKNALTTKTRPDPADRREMIRILGDCVYSIAKRPGRAALRKIVNSIVSQYPESFQDKVKDSVIGDGNSTLLAQLEYRMDNLNRDNSVLKRASFAVVPGSDGCSTLQVKRNRSSDSYGCVDYQPEVPKGKDLEEIKQMQTEMISKSVLLNVHWLDIENSMRATFGLQRADINGGATTGNLLKEWPFLFFSQGLDLHFTLLVGQPLLKTMKAACTSKIPQIVKYFEENGKSKMKSVVCDLKNAKEEVASTFPEVIGVIQLLAMQFGESLDELISLRDVSMFW